MRATLVKMGNSQGVRLPKAVIAQARLVAELELEVVDGAVVLRPAARVRAGWAEAARACEEAGEGGASDWDTATGDFAGEWR